MSDNNISIVPKQSSYRGNREAKAAEIIDWLVGEGAIEPTTRSNCVYGEEGYRLLPGMSRFCVKPECFLPNLDALGLIVSTKKTVFHTGTNGLDKISCPYCRSDVSEELFFELIDNWFHGRRNAMTCLTCTNNILIEEIITEWTWAFSDFGFTFWNSGTLREDFIAEFEKRLGCPVSVVYCHL